MDPEEILKLHDFASACASAIPNDSSICRKAEGYSFFIGHKSVGRFSFVVQVRLGPRGGVLILACLIDRDLKPLTDSLRLIRENSILIPTAFRLQVIDLDFLDVMNLHLARLPSDETFYEREFDRLEEAQPRDSIRGLQGGAPGLRR